MSHQKDNPYPSSGQLPFSKPKSLLPNSNFSSSSSGNNSFQKPTESDFPPGLGGKNLFQALSKEDQQLLGPFGTQVKQSSFEAFLNDTKIGSGHKEFKQRLMERFGGKSSINMSHNSSTILGSTEASIMNDLPKNHTGGTLEAPWASKSTATSYTVNPCEETINQSFTSYTGKPILPSSLNRTLEDSRDYQPPKGIVESIQDLVDDNKICCVPLLNEIGSKVKKQVDCILKEVVVNKIRQ